LSHSGGLTDDETLLSRPQSNSVVHRELQQCDSGTMSHHVMHWKVSEKSDDDDDDNDDDDVDYDERLVVNCGRVHG